ncbi:MAG: Rieske 2Fe-2S domain-containing protein [Conexivisphaerales archaeon]
MERFQLNGFPAFSVKLSDETTVAYLDFCPHKGRPITANGFKVERDNIVCPFHFAKFDLKTGTLVEAPISKTPCMPPCRLVKVIFNGKNEPVGFDSEPRMPQMP